MDKIAFTKTYISHKAIVRVHYPDISDEENERRRKIVEKAAIKVLKEKIRAERAREREKANQQ